MDHLGYIVALLLLAWAAWHIYQGYLAEQHPPLTLRDNGHGLMEPVCPHCQARLIVVERKTSSGLVGLAALLLGLLGVTAFLFNWVVGSVVLILALLLNGAGKGRQTVLTCPACGSEAKRIA